MRVAKVYVRRNRLIPHRQHLAGLASKLTQPTASLAYVRTRGDVPECTHTERELTSRLRCVCVCARISLHSTLCVLFLLLHCRHD